MGFRLFWVHPTVVSVLLSASVERCFVSRMRDFYFGIVIMWDGWTVVANVEMAWEMWDS